MTQKIITIICFFLRLNILLLQKQIIRLHCRLAFHRRANHDEKNNFSIATSVFSQLYLLRSPIELNIIKGSGPAVRPPFKQVAL